MSAELGHGQSSTLQATVMVSEVTSTAALRAERLGQESGKICCFGSVPLWFKCTPLIFIYLFVCFSPENKTCSMCSICNVCCSHVGRVCCAHDAGYKDQCTKMHWWHRPVLMTLLPAPSPWFSLPVAKMLWFSATHLLEGCRGYLNHLQVLTCSPAPWRPACRRDKWGQQ